MESENRQLAQNPKPRAMAERQRVDRAARRARNLALAYWIDHLVRSGEVADLAAVARMCEVSRARLTVVLKLTCVPMSDQQRTVDHLDRTELTPPALRCCTGIRL